MKKVFMLLIAVSLFACSKSGSESANGILSPRAFSNELKEKNEIVVIDVRSSAEMQSGYIAGAYHLDYNAPTFANSLDSLDHSKTYFLYCASGKRSGKALEIMNEKGFKNVAAMEGGLRAWNANGLPMFQPQQP